MNVFKLPEVVEVWLLLLFEKQEYAVIKENDRQAFFGLLNPPDESVPADELVDTH
ncbi:hypothetical protein S7335_891 [Synechococcus sp. PCC 7335]|uniref:hypothetical protein n=1 Tax=Synechococcus sp. (strain ATCC 29403 / PCC 7335) TaxID=91464 RepID=UPI00017EC83B|nr:hypothetical protein [Synechococcus sp. PCC 7335]EDX82334.1 hypothetical protein S7335_891 [Synechococcus sp. PCC 7335]